MDGVGNAARQQAYMLETLPNQYRGIHVYLSASLRARLFVCMTGCLSIGSQSTVVYYVSCKLACLRACQPFKPVSLCGRLCGRLYDCLFVCLTFYL